MNKSAYGTPMTLLELATAIGVTTATLRQRIARGSLTARKVGPVWVVDPAECDRVIRAGRLRA
jgi:hypothetical protein